MENVKIIAIPVPGEPRHLRTFYRPVSLLSPAMKIIEGLILLLLNLHLKHSTIQHGFRVGRPTIVALLPLLYKLASGFNKPRPPPLRILPMAMKYGEPRHNEPNKPHNSSTYRIYPPQLHLIALVLLARTFFPLAGTWWPLRHATLCGLAFHKAQSSLYPSITYLYKLTREFLSPYILRCRCARGTIIHTVSKG